MPNCDPDQKKRVDELADLTIAQKVEALQERMRRMGAVSDGSDDKASWMTLGARIVVTLRDEALRPSIDPSLSSGPQSWPIKSSPNCGRDAMLSPDLS